MNLIKVIGIIGRQNIFRSRDIAGRRRYKSRFAAAVIIGADHISFIFWIRAAGIIKRIKPAHHWRL